MSNPDNYNFDFNENNDNNSSLNQPKSSKSHKSLPKTDDFNAHLLAHKIVEEFSRDPKLIANPIQKRLENLPLQEVSLFTISLLIWYTNGFGIFNSIDGFFNKEKVDQLAEQKLISNKLEITDHNKEKAEQQVIELLQNYISLIDVEAGLTLDTIYQKLLSITNDLYKPNFEAKYSEVVDQIIEQIEINKGITIDTYQTTSNSLFVSEFLSNYYHNLAYLISSTAEALISKDHEQMVFNAQILSVLHIYLVRNLFELFTFKPYAEEDYIKSDLYKQAIDIQWLIYRTLDAKFTDPKTKQRKAKIANGIKVDNLISLVYEKPLLEFANLNLELIKTLDKSSITKSYNLNNIDKLKLVNFSLSKGVATTEQLQQVKLNYVNTCQVIYVAFMENTKDLLNS